MHPPSRDDVATRWQAVARGEMRREEAHQWAETQMFAEFTAKADVMAFLAVQSLHGFDMTYRSDDERLIGHGPPGPYVRSLTEIASELDGWMEQCHAYDANPEAWVAGRRLKAEAVVREEQLRRESKGASRSSR